MRIEESGGSMIQWIENLKYNPEGALTVDGVSLLPLTQQYGTPLFVASRRRIEANVERFFKAFSSYGREVILSYSTKTNSNVGVLQVLLGTKAFAGVCSGLDYAAARRAGFPPERIIFDGLYKREEDLKRAVQDRIRLINVESWEELKKIDDLSRAQGVVTPVGLRVRIGDSHLHLSVKSLMGIGYDRFGFDVRSGLAGKIIDQAQELKNIQIQGLLVHEGSHYFSSKPYLSNFQYLIPLIRKIAALSPGQFKYLNLGGGLGVATVKPYQLSDLIRNTYLRFFGKPAVYDLSARRFELEKMAGEIIAETTRFFEQEKLPLPALVFEPGRYVTGDAFVLAAKVVLRKNVPGSGTWLVLDAGTNLFPYLLSFNEYHQIVPAVHKEGPREVVHLAGPLLYSSDIVMKNAWLPHLEAGDMTAILDAGAYTLAYSNQFLYPRPAVVMIDGAGQAKVIRETETTETVLAHDRTF